LWTIGEERGDVTPHGLQHMLSRASWDEDAVAGDVRDYVTTAFADPDAVLVLDETGDVKKGVATGGVQRQCFGTAGRIENSQVAVYLTYAAVRGHALIDGALYLPKSWTEDPSRRVRAGVPDDIEFATKPVLAQRMIVDALDALDAGVLASWVAVDEVYGGHCAAQCLPAPWRRVRARRGAQPLRGHRAVSGGCPGGGDAHVRVAAPVGRPRQ